MQHERDFETGRPPHDILMRRQLPSNSEQSLFFGEVSREEAAKLLHFISYLDGWIQVHYVWLPPSERPSRLEEEERNFLALMQYKSQLTMLNGYYHPVTYEGGSVAYPKKDRGVPTLDDMQKLEKIIEKLGTLLFDQEKKPSAPDTDNFPELREALEAHIIARKFGFRIIR